MNRASRLFRTNPLLSASTLGTSGVVASAFWIEYRSERSGLTHLPRDYDFQAINEYWLNRPVSSIARFAKIFRELAPVSWAYVRDFELSSPSTEEESVALQIQHAAALREALTELGPAFVKGGQQLSIRPDLVSPAVLRELQKLCDAVRPIPDEIAMEVIRKELHVERVEDVYSDLDMVASASLGQVYKGVRRSTGESVAVKVQRPDMRRSFSLDLFLLQKFGVAVDAFTSVCTNQPPFHSALYESFSKGSYLELDYCQEANNQQMFQRELTARKCKVIIPNVHEDLTTERILTSEWVDGIKLADASRERIQQLIPVGVELFLTQLLDLGRFHCDPHPGNLLVNKKGELVLLDFGLCANVGKQERDAITKAIVHLLVRDFDTLVSEDAIELGFLPPDFDASELKPLLSKILTVAVVEGGSSDLRKRKKKLMDISNELNEVFFKYPFSVPPFFALVTRGLGLLEGIALAGDPDFDIFQASAPYARRRAVAILGAHSFRRFTNSKSMA